MPGLTWRTRKLFKLLPNTQLEPWLEEDESVLDTAQDMIESLVEASTSAKDAYSDYEISKLISEQLDAAEKAKAKSARQKAEEEKANREGKMSVEEQDQYAHTYWHKLPPVILRQRYLEQ